MSAWGKVAVLMGGSSAEREVSLMSGRNVLEALRAQGIDAHAFDPARQDIWQLNAQHFDSAFVILHGRGGEDGVVQGALETMGIPYTGSGVMASALAMDKWRTKMIWQAAGIATPRYRIVQSDSGSGSDMAEIIDELKMPLMLKAVHEGSSIGIAKVDENNVGQIDSILAEIRQHDGLVLAEEFVVGTELTAAVLNQQALPLVRIDAPGSNYDFEHKYFSDDTQYFCPSGIDVAVEEKIKTEAMRAFQVIGCRGWGRLDVILRDDGSWTFLEINTLPGMTAHSLVPIAAREAGIDFEQLCLMILKDAYVA